MNYEPVLYDRIVPYPIGVYCWNRPLVATLSIRQTDPDYCALAIVLEVRSRSHLNPLTSIACQRQYNLGQEYDIYCIVFLDR